MRSISKKDIPAEIQEIAFALQDAGFEAYLVGGCARDLFLGKEPNDWDFTTNALPEQIMDIFPHAFYENDFGTVGVVNDETDIERYKMVEVTTYRTESDYSDNRRPDTVTFSKNIEDDLQRRDFTMNAIAISVSRETSDLTIKDPFRGQEAIRNRVIDAVGDAHSRFDEDALRIMRAVRFHAEHDFAISAETMEAILEYAPRLETIAIERIRDEFEKIIMSKSPMTAMAMCHRLNMLPYILPELLKAFRVEQGGAHSYDVFEHLLRSLQCAADKGWELDIRLAALLHDIGKPVSYRWPKDKKKPTFYGHEVVGARMTKEILERLKFPKDTVTRVTKLVRWHMFFSDPDKITLSAVRRMIANVGQDDIWTLMSLRIADRVGTGRPKEEPYRFRKYQSMIEEALRDPVSVKMLKIDGSKLMEVTQETPGPKLGLALHALLEEVLDDPDLNTENYLVTRGTEMLSMEIENLRELGEAGKKKIELEEEAALGQIRKEYKV